MFLRGANDYTMAHIYHQVQQTCIRDAELFIELAYIVLVPVWVRMPKKDSTEYDLLVGAGAFYDALRDCVMSGDMTPVFIVRPGVLEKLFFDVHHGGHCYHMLSLACGHGYTRFVAGPFAGAIRDAIAMENINLTAMLKEYVYLISYCCHIAVILLSYCLCVTDIMFEMATTCCTTTSVAAYGYHPNTTTNEALSL